MQVLLDSLHNTVMTVQNRFLTMVFLRFEHSARSVNLYFFVSPEHDPEGSQWSYGYSADSALPLTTPTDSACIYFYSLKSDPEENYITKNHSLMNRYRTGLDTNQKHQYKRHQYKRPITQHKRYSYTQDFHLEIFCGLESTP